MNQLVKFNQRGRRVDDKAKVFAFGIIIGELSTRYFSFRIVDNRRKEVRFINMNEWKIFDIYQQAYFTREKLLFTYCTPDGSLHSFETGGRTIPLPIDADTKGVIRFLEEVLTYFHRLSCFECVEDVIEKRKQLEKKGKLRESEKYNHNFMLTW